VRGIVRDRVDDHHVPSRRHARLYVYMADQSSSIGSPEEAGTPPSVRPLLVTVLQAGEILCLSRSSIYQLIWKDELIPIRIGKSVRFSVEQLGRFVAERCSDRAD